MSLSLHEVHQSLGASFTTINGLEAVAHYIDPAAEYRWIQNNAGVIDLGFRGRFCLTGSDRVRLLHGQVTNDVQGLPPFRGCYAAFVNNKGRMQSDAFIHALAEEILIDVEPGLTEPLLRRLDHYIVADDVLCVDVAPHYGLLSVQGPRAMAVIARLALTPDLPARSLDIVRVVDPLLGELYLVRNARTGTDGCDLFVPLDAQAMVLDKLIAAARDEGGGIVGWDAFEWARIEAGIPRFGADMDETTLAPEAAIEARAISYSKGCYIGQEVIARVRTYGQVAKALRGLRMMDPTAPLPTRGDKLFRAGREVGHVTSAIRSPRVGGVIALGYVRRECNTPGTELQIRCGDREFPMGIVPLPFAV
jgi:glycine cleavage system aminomethyltransferase T